jgi:hypothetical protein
MSRNTFRQNNPMAAARAADGNRESSGFCLGDDHRVETIIGRRRCVTIGNAGATRIAGIGVICGRPVLWWGRPFRLGFHLHATADRLLEQ